MLGCCCCSVESSLEGDAKHDLSGSMILSGGVGDVTVTIETSAFDFALTALAV